ncbi:MAG: precorrin-4 C(11)-methyltransferase [Deferribacteraceae bacterium]|jgi:precorrin-4/cobalt-precorrin-4 C11-methyltransferase|nr:precorrin-4 C(11)-methyltransferase [Deferribacteraceae bacterium]
MKGVKTPKVYFIGAGPGDPELITVKAVRIMRKCRTVITAGSLVSPEILKYSHKEARIYNSAAMALPEIIETINDACKRGDDTARLHTGDPSLYGAIFEQMAELNKLSVPYEIIPGVTSLFAAAAALKCELTAPELSQTVIITRYAGRTPVPEDFTALAKAGGTLCIYLSLAMLNEITEEVIKAGRSPDTPAAVVYRASWQDEKVISGVVSTIAEMAAGLKNHGLIIIGDVAGGSPATFSRLYDPAFSHGYR